MAFCSRYAAWVTVTVVVTVTITFSSKPTGAEVTSQGDSASVWRLEAEVVSLNLKITQTWSTCHQCQRPVGPRSVSGAYAHAHSHAPLSVTFRTPLWHFGLHCDISDSTVTFRTPLWHRDDSHYSMLAALSIPRICIPSETCWASLIYVCMRLCFYAFMRLWGGLIFCNQPKRAVPPCGTRSHTPYLSQSPPQCSCFECFSM